MTFSQDLLLYNAFSGIFVLNNSFIIILYICKIVCKYDILLAYYVCVESI